MAGEVISSSQTYSVSHSCGTFYTVGLFQSRALPLRLAPVRRSLLGPAKIAVPIIPPTTLSVIVPTDGMVVLQNFEHCNRQRSEESRQWQRACLAIGL